MKTARKDLFYKGYLDIEVLNEEIDKSGSDGIEITVQDKATETETTVDITRRLPEETDKETALKLDEESRTRGGLVYYQNVLDELRESPGEPAYYGFYVGENQAYIYEFRLLSETAITEK